MKEEKNTKKSKVIIIIAILLITAIVGGIGGYYIYQQHEQNKTVGTAWGDKYHMYLKNAVADTQSDKNDVYGMPNNMEDTKIQFIETNKNEPPKMAMTYKVDGNEYVNIYYIKDDDTIGYMAYKQPSSLQLLYNIELKQYIWYVHIVDGNNHSYKPVDSKVEEQNSTANESSANVENITSENVTTNNTNTTTEDTATKVETDADYTFTEEEMKSDDKEVAEGEIPTISKFEDTFVVPEIEDNRTSVDLHSTVEDKVLKEAVKGAVESYKTEEKIITEEVKTQTEDTVSKLETKKEEIKKAEEEAKRKAEEEAARKAAEEAAKGLKVGNYTIKYGTYAMDENSIYKLVINADGTASETLTNGNRTYDQKYTYKVEQHDFAQDISSHIYETAIVLYNSDGTIGGAYFPISSTELSTGDGPGYVYSGN